MSSSAPPIPAPSLFSRLFGRTDPRERMRGLYDAVVAQGRAEHWYARGLVPDTLDGRFDMIVAILAQVLLRLEHEDKAQESVWLTELFVEDMDGQLRQEGVGDVVVGKHVGRMMSALGGRIAAYRAALGDDSAPGGPALREALLRNLYRGEAPGEAAIAHVEAEMRAGWARRRALPVAALLAGDIG